MSNKTEQETLGMGKAAEGYSQAVAEIKQHMEANAKQYYSPEAMKNHECLGEGCGVCGALSTEYRKGVL